MYDVYYEFYIESIRVATCRELAILVPKGINWFPSNEDKMKNTIDIWWIVRILVFLIRGVVRLSAT